MHELREKAELINWQYFATIPLSRGSSVLPRSKSIWNGFRGRFAKKLGASPKRLMWIAVLELGRFGANPHIHAIFGGLPQTVSADDAARAMLSASSAMGLSSPKSEVYDDRRNAIAYMLKEQKDDEGRWLIFSDNLRDAIRRRKAIVRNSSFRKGYADA